MRRSTPSPAPPAQSDAKGAVLSSALAATELVPPAPLEATEEDEEAPEEALEAAPEGLPAELAGVEHLQMVDELLEDAYDKALKVHGWKMEVPGDPLGLK